MTEEEATKRWCPFVKLGVAHDNSCWNNRGDDDHYSKCIGSYCMAWRTDALPVAVNSASPDGQGYCGLAGKP